MSLLTATPPPQDDGVPRPQRGDGTAPRPTATVLAEVSGKLPEYSKLVDGTQLLSHIPLVGAQEESYKPLGKVLMDSGGEVKKVRFDPRPEVVSKLWFFHLDFLAVAMETGLNLLGEFRSRLLPGTHMPVYQVMFPKPIFTNVQGPPELTHSLLAVPKNVVAESLAVYILETGFTRRFTKKQQEEYRTHTGKELLNQYWEVKLHKDMPDTLCGVKFDLFLPSGIDYEYFPVYLSPQGPIKLQSKAPDDRVVAAAYKVFTQGHDVVNTGGNLSEH